jgi:hypothetical protein
MQTLVLVHRFRGRLTDVGPGLCDAALWADGVRLCSQLSFLDEHRFHEAGTIDFGGGQQLRFRTLTEGELTPSPDPAVRHGTAMREIAGGAGRLTGARGRVTSNFLVSADGDVTDDEVVVVFVKEEES